MQNSNVVFAWGGGGGGVIPLKNSSLEFLPPPHPEVSEVSPLDLPDPHPPVCVSVFGWRWWREWMSFVRVFHVFSNWVAI